MCELLVPILLMREELVPIVLMHDELVPILICKRIWYQFYTCRMNWLQFFTHVRGIGTNFSHMKEELVPIIHTRISRIGCVAWPNRSHTRQICRICIRGEGLF